MEKQPLHGSCHEAWNATYTDGLRNGCLANFDGFTCWPPTPSNHSSFVHCPTEFSLIEMDYNRNRTSQRYCFPNGSWDVADYTECLSNLAEFYSSEISSLRHLKVMYYVYWIGYTISLMFLLAALVIFINYRSLWCLRNIIHSNLILCFACHCATWIAYSTIAYEILMKHLLYEFVRHCFIATIMLKYFVTAGFFWMFVEGLYLLVSVRFSFRRNLISYTLCASIGWGIPLLLIAVSSAMRAQTEHEGCWNEPSPLDYIFLGPVVVALIINFFILLIVLRILFRQLKVTGFEEVQKLKKIAKGLFVLCPLLGTSYVFTLVQPHHPQWLVLVFSYITTILASTQGIVIAVLFCFSNSEVIFCIKKSYSQYLERWHPRRCSSCYMKLFGSLSESSRETSC
uniref:G-protein coupled receptors family 2 profile 2 domain-containing protein n=1 Tax=Trichuris muris TaxID=70415 RepID=A0A5S6QN07_TRIMR